MISPRWLLPALLLACSTVAADPGPLREAFFVRGGFNAWSTDNPPTPESNTPTDATIFPTGSSCIRAPDFTSISTNRHWKRGSHALSPLTGAINHRCRASVVTG